MTVFTKTAVDIFAAQDSSGAKRKVANHDVQVWGTEVERVINTALGVTTKVQGGWDASGGSFPGSGTAEKGDTWIVTTAGTVDGVDFRVGDMVVAITDNASTTTYGGNWARFAAALDPVVHAVDSGAGTSNAIEITASRPVSPDGGQLISFVPAEDTDGSPVTLQVSDSTGAIIGPYRIKTAAGNDPNLTDETTVVVQLVGNEWVMLSDQATAELLAAAEAAAERAEDAAGAAENAASRAQSYSAMLSADKVKFNTVAALLADETMSYTSGAGLIEVGPGDIIEAEGFRYEVAPLVVVDYDIATSGGVLLYALPNVDGSYDMRQFGFVFDGVTDNASANARLASAMARKPRKLVAPEGTALCSTKIEVPCGLKGAGMGLTGFKWINDGTAASVGIIEPTGPGLLSDFWVDGDVSDDPVAWDSSNYDDFTGAQGVYIRSDNIILANVRANNCRRGGINGWGVKNILLYNCHTERTRGNFGDGFFFYYNCEHVSAVNCSAKDYTRIGFVFDGDGSNPSYGLNLMNFYAENGHDRSLLYGGIENNAAVWVENCGFCVIKNVRGKNVGNRGVVVAIGSGATTVGFASVSVSDCFVEDVEAQAYVFGALDSNRTAAGLIHAINCGSKGAIRGFDITSGARVVLDQCFYEQDGHAGNYSPVIVGPRTDVTIRKFREKWSNRDESKLADNNILTGSIVQFAGPDQTRPDHIRIDDWKSDFGERCVIKIPTTLAGSGNSSFYAEDTDLWVVSLNMDGPVEVVRGSVMARGSTGSVAISGEKIDISADILLHSSLVLNPAAMDRSVHVKGGTVTRVTGGASTARIHVRRSPGLSGTSYMSRFDNVTFSADFSAGNILNQLSEVDGFNNPGQSMMLFGCVFENLGDAPSDTPIGWSPNSVDAGRIHLVNCLKSGNITDLANSTFVATGATVFDLGY